jgi:hypothetical protein
MSYRNQARRAFLYAWLLAAAGLAGGQEVIPPPPVLGPPPPVLEELDEAKVRATKLWQMRQNLISAEERFYALYNELNKDDDYDVHCKVEAPLGTRLKSRICRIAFYEEAQADEAQALLGGYQAPPPQQVMLERYPEFQKTALALINKDPRLRRLVREREEMERKYLAERQRRFKGKWILFE